MVEVQAHGFSFEKWVRDTFFAGYTGNYMQEWDVPPEDNQGHAIPAEFRNLPVSIKTAKYGSPINLGDVLRQRQIAADFIMIVGFWRQRTPTEKWFEEIGVVRFTAATWAALWGELTLEQLRAIDREVKDMGLPYATARLHARDWKRHTPAVGTARFVINPKIDSKTQRRIQCSLPFAAFWQQAGRPPQPADTPLLWGVPFSNPVRSAPRRFNNG